MGSHEKVLSEAAIRVLAEMGSRGFTHRAVDLQAGLPEGTASRYARSREALFVMALNALFALDASDTGHASGAEGSLFIQSAEDFVQAVVAGTCALLMAPDRYKARLELQLEACRAPGLAEHLTVRRSLFVTAVASVLDRLQVDAAAMHADILVAMVDGILHRQIVLQAAPLGLAELKHIFQSYLAPLVERSNQAD